jgi:hypothetical protein
MRPCAVKAPAIIILAIFVIAPSVLAAEFPDWAFPGCPASPRSATADYFAKQSVKSFVRVIERVEVPNHRSACFMYTPGDGRAVPLQSTDCGKACGP